MNIDTTFLRQCIARIERTAEEYDQLEDSTDAVHEIYLETIVSQFERVLEQSGKLLRKRLAAFFASNLHVDRLEYKDLFRHAARHGLIDIEAVERWFGYRDHSGATAGETGERSPDAIFGLIPSLIVDARSLAEMIGEDQSD